MANIGKRFLSAFVEVENENETQAANSIVEQTTEPKHYEMPATASAESTAKFKAYFDTLFAEANMPGPDFFEFQKMTEAMQSISDEKAKYLAAFAGLSVQGLTRQKLVQSIARYQEVLEADATNFNNSVDAALMEKVQAKKEQILEVEKRISELQTEITSLQQQTVMLQNEVKENEEKIKNNSGAYRQELAQMKQKLQTAAEKIEQYISS